MQPAAASKKTITAAPNTIRRSTAPVFGVASVRFPFFDVFPLLFFLFDEVLCVFPLLLWESCVSSVSSYESVSSVSSISSVYSVSS